MNVIVVTDIDWIIPSFFFIREGGEEAFLPATQNVTFILNIVDKLAGVDRFMDIRKRTRIHRTLAKIDEATSASRDEASKKQDEFIEDITKKEEAARKAMAEKIDQVESRTDISDMEKDVLLEQVRMREQNKLDADVRALASQRRRQIKENDYKLESGYPLGSRPLQTLRDPDPADSAAAVGAGRLLPPPRTGTPRRLPRTAEVSGKTNEPRIKRMDLLTG